MILYKPFSKTARTSHFRTLCYPFKNRTYEIIQFIYAYVDKSMITIIVYIITFCISRYWLHVLIQSIYNSNNNMNQTYECNPLGNYSNYFKWNATAEYEGIPENLFINWCGFILLFICFLILRKSAFKVANTEVTKTNRKITKEWKSLFFSINCTTPNDFNVYSNTVLGRYCKQF